MHGRHIALFPLPGKSHVSQFLGLCPELTRRGYRVTLATIEPLAKFVTRAGAEPVIFETDRLLAPTAGLRGLLIDDPERWEEVARIASRWLLNSAAIATRQLNGFYTEHRPDLVIYELSAYAGRILARRLHSPAIQYYPEFIQHRDYVCWEGSVGPNPPSIVEFSRLLDSFLWAHGFEEQHNFWHSEDLNLYQFPRAFQFKPDSIDSRRFFFTGPLLDRQFQPAWENRSNGKPIILVSAAAGSTDASYFNITIEALSGSGYHVILSVGDNFPIGKLRTLPANFEINTCASHLEILPHTALHLYSGGPTGTLEGLHFGVPLIALPTLELNYIIASRLADLGLVINLPLHTLTAEMLREHVEAALKNSTLISRVMQMQPLIRNCGGSVMAVDRIEEYLSVHT